MKFGKRLQQYRPLLFIGIATLCVWFGASMSDVGTYPATYRVVWTGYDEARYAVVDRDSTISLHIRSNGFRALGRSLSRRDRYVTIDLSGRFPKQHGENFLIGVPANEDVATLVRQLHLCGVKDIRFGSDSLRISMAERRCRAYVPKVRDVDFAFSPQFGVLGEISVIPDTIYLYGSAESLAKLEEIYTSPTTIANISATDTILLDLAPVWEKYADLYPSASQVRLCVPVGRYTESKVTVPVIMQGIDTAMRYRLYPDRVEVVYWVPSSQYALYDAEDFSVVANFEHQAGDGIMLLNVSSFPKSCRIKNITPDHVRIVAIK